MALNQNPFEKSDIPLVKVKKDWWEIWWKDLGVGIVVVVVGGLILQGISSRNHEIEQQDRVKQPSVKKADPPIRPINEKTEEQHPQVSNLVIDVIPRPLPEYSKSDDLPVKIRAGQEVSVKCNPTWVPSASPLHAYDRIALSVESIVFDQSFTALHVAVKPGEGAEQDVLLRSAVKAYLTDDNGYRYDLQKDDGSYSLYLTRDIKPDEIYRFSLIFLGKMRPTEKLLFHHPQFQPITVWLPWAQAISHRVLPDTGALQKPEIATHKSGKQSSTLPKPCGENGGIVMLKNGFSVRYDRRETSGSSSRFFTSTGYLDIANDEIVGFEKCTE